MIIKKTALLLIMAAIGGCGTHRKTDDLKTIRHESSNLSRSRASGFSLTSAPYVTQGIGDISAAHIAVIRDIMATRAVRMHHYLWHTLRRGMDFLDTEELAFVTSLGWEPPSYSSRDDRAGEDFLYMHRLMIETLNQGFASQGLDPIAGWSDIPGPDDQDYPFEQNGSYASSQAGYDAIKKAELKFEDDEYLRTITLGRLGQEMESQIHNSLHNRWSQATLPDLGNNPKSPRVELTNEPPADWIYDSPDYDYLGAPYGSQVHPIFWKLHGWIDLRMSQWLKANNFQTIGFTDACVVEKSCYRWQGTWAGPGHQGSHHKMTSNNIFQTIQNKLKADPKIRPTVESLSEKLSRYSEF